MYRASSLLKRRNNSNHHLLNARREIWPIIVGTGTVILLSYAFRALKRLEEESSPNSSSESSGSSSRKQSDRILAIVGVDVGSTRSRVAIQRADDVRAFVVENREGKRSTASMVHFTSKSYDFEKLMSGTEEHDKDAIVVGSTASNFRFRKPDQTYSGSDLLFGRRNLKVDERAAMYSLLALDMKNVAEDSYATSENDTRSTNNTQPHNSFYFAVPNALRTIDASAMVLACASAGLAIEGLIPDAVAAVSGACEVNLLSSRAIKHVMIVDIGGSMVQLAAVRLHPSPINNGSSGSNAQLSLPVVLSQITLTQNGGTYYDDQIVTFLNDEFEKRYPGIRIIDDPMAKQRLYDAAESVKIELSSAVNSIINLPFLTANQTGPKHLECELSRNQFERLIDKYVLEIEQTMVSKELSCSFDALLITGGGGRIPHLVSRLEKIAKVKLNIPVICIDSQPEDMNIIGIVAYAKLLKNLSA